MRLVEGQEGEEKRRGRKEGRREGGREGGRRRGGEEEEGKVEKGGG